MQPAIHLRVMSVNHNSNKHFRTMTKSQLVESLSLKQTHLMLRDVDASVEIILDAIAKALTRDDRVELRGFGSFVLSRRRARIGRNPKTGKAVEIKPARVPHFKPGKELRERVRSPAVDAMAE